jgi:hypothetical protein
VDDIPFGKALAFLLLGGLAGSVAGCYQCVEGQIYRVAAEHESTAVGRVVGFYTGRGGSFAYHYVFSVNEVAMDDYSEVCSTPLTPGACDKKGSVLVYYAYQPFANSRLEDFAIASKRAFRLGEMWLAIGLPVFVLPCAVFAVLARKNKGEGERDSARASGRNTPDDAPDDLHIAPRE